VSDTRNMDDQAPTAQSELHAGPTLRLADLMTGVVATLALRGCTYMHVGSKSFDDAMAEAARRLTEAGYDLRFRIIPDPLHGGSETMRTELLYMLQRGLVIGDGPLARFTWIGEGAQALLTDDLTDTRAYDIVADVLCAGDRPFAR
jgi:hypothetical protein